MNEKCNCSASEPAVDLHSSTGNCPLCGNPGTAVPNVTVEHMVKPGFRAFSDVPGYRVCLNSECDAVYYNPEFDWTFTRNMIKVPIGFKNDAQPCYICYCSKITREQILEAVTKGGASSVEEVRRLVGAHEACDCLRNHPLGTCCYRDIEAMIEQLT